jgi:energy-converting hydrogenase Eha subunit B
MSRLTGALWGALILGGIGFAGGFFGPIVFAPEANQGPLLGIFITGPIGAILGGVLGAIFGPSIRLPAKRT